MIFWVAGGPPACARERGCGGGSVWEIVVIVVLALAIVAGICGWVWFKWERGPFPLIARLVGWRINRRQR